MAIHKKGKSQKMERNSKKVRKIVYYFTDYLPISFTFDLSFCAVATYFQFINMNTTYNYYYDNDFQGFITEEEVL